VALGILLGLTAALSWGAADFMARYSTRRIGAYRTLIYMQAAGLAFATVSLGIAGGSFQSLGSGLTAHWRLALFLGASSGLSMLAFYGALEKGTLSVVAPISSSYPALTILLGWASGERLTWLRMLGVACALGGVVLASVADAGPNSSEHPSSEGNTIGPGVLLAIAAAAGFGITYWALGFLAVPAWGAINTVWIQRCAGTLLLSAAVVPLRGSLAPPPGRGLALVAVVGVLDAFGFLVSNWGFQREQVGVVTVLGSLFSAVTLLLALVVLRERLSRRQWFGVALIFAGILLINSPAR
jgi:drug/metabolite transporter (DMT)-like permease